MRGVSTRRVCFAGSAVAIECQGERASRIVDFLFRYVPAGEEGDSTPSVTFRLTPGSQAGQLALYRDGELLRMGDSDAALAERLLGEVGHDLAEKSQGGLLFHAGALAWNGQGLLLPGSISAGKTTLTMWLALKGGGDLEYLSDEMVFFPGGSQAMQSYTRPLNLKSPSRAALGDSFDFAGQAGRLLSTAYGDLIPPDLLGFAGVRRPPPLRLVIFPCYQADCDPLCQPLSKAQAGLALMECLVNARNLPGHGLSEIARLARVAPAYRLRYSHFEQIERQIEALLQQDLTGF
jgi:hypothetical protein